jgi:transcriptional regulator with XRE-family HTH domain
MTTFDQSNCAEDLKSLLKRLRARVDRDAATLGEYERPNARRGKLISQEELAEAVGVSRCWYAMLERGTAAQPSLAFLSRLARALSMTRDERRSLLELAVPMLRDF